LLVLCKQLARLRACCAAQDSASALTADACANGPTKRKGPAHRLGLRTWVLAEWTGRYSNQLNYHSIACSPALLDTSADKIDLAMPAALRLATDLLRRSSGQGGAHYSAFRGPIKSTTLVVKPQCVHPVPPISLASPVDKTSCFRGEPAHPGTPSAACPMGLRSARKFFCLDAARLGPLLERVHQAQAAALALCRWRLGVHSVAECRKLINAERRQGLAGFLRHSPVAIDEEAASPASALTCRASRRAVASRFPTAEAQLCPVEVPPEIQPLCSGLLASASADAAFVDLRGRGIAPACRRNTALAWAHPSGVAIDLKLSYIAPSPSGGGRRHCRADSVCRRKPDGRCRTLPAASPRVA